jgi:hypothetical protein
MNFRFRPELMSLEARENPTGLPVVDPFGGGAVPPADPLPPATPLPPAEPAYASPLLTIIAMTTEATLIQLRAQDPLLQNSSLTGEPIVR